MKVVHCKKEPFDVYIGRPTVWGNPFSEKEESLAEFHVSSREEAIDRYAAWILTQPDLIQRAKEHLRGKVLGCWCKPKACHGDVLLRIANGDDSEDSNIDGTQATVEGPSDGVQGSARGS